MKRTVRVMTLATGIVAAAALVAGCDRNDDMSPSVAAGASDAVGDEANVAENRTGVEGQGLGSVATPGATGDQAALGSGSTANDGLSPNATLEQNPTGAGTPTSTGPLTEAEQRFVTQATQSSLYEVAVARLAADKATNPAVKSMASMLVDDHTRAADKLSQLVGNRATLPSSLPADKQKIIDRLSKATGAEFDRQFVQTVGIKDHQADIALFEKAQNDAQDPALRDFIQTTLPNLRHHLSAAQELAKSTGSKS